MLVACLCSPWNGRSISRAKTALLFSTLLMLGSTTGLIIIRDALWIIQVPLFGFNPPDNWRVVARLFVAGWWLTRINVSSFLSLSVCNQHSDLLQCIIGDAIVVWRAWILWDRNVTARILLSFCIFCTFGICLPLCDLLAPDTD